MSKQTTETRTTRPVHEVRLGLIKGYRMASEAERCTGAAETRALAQRFVDQVRELDGDVAGIALAQVLIAPE